MKPWYPPLEYVSQVGRYRIKGRDPHGLVVET